MFFRLCQSAIVISIVSSLVACSLLLIGCGGGGGGGGPASNVRFTVDWPSRGRYVPPYANSVKGTLTVNSVLFTATVNRVGNGASQGMGTFSTVAPPGTHSLLVQAFTGTSATGSLVAQATLNVNVIQDQITTVPVSGNLQSTIDHLEIDGKPLSVPAGLQIQLAGHAEDSTGATLLNIPPVSFTWAVTTGGAFGSVTSSGLFTGIAEGSETVRMSETGAGLQVTADVTITPGPSGSLPPNKIFFGVGTISGVDFSFMDPDGSNVTPWLTLPRNIPAAALSPDGTTWAFFHSPDPDAVTPVYELYRNSTPTITGATRITSTAQNYRLGGTVQYTGDGGTVVYTASLSEIDFKLHKVAAAGGAPTVIFSNVDEAQVHPLTNKIVFTRLVSGFGEIATINLDGTGLATLAPNPPPPSPNEVNGEDWMPQWSKDGTKVVFSTHRNGNFEIYTINANNTGLFRVTNTVTPNDEFGPSFSADGAQISFTLLGNDIDVFGVYRANAGGTGYTSLFLHSAIQLSTYWSFSSGFRPTPTGGMGGFSLVQRDIARRRRR